ncbi:PilX N-terminal domain-containing pilus assembly protein [Oleiagrimonas sp. C23AA]|uniref:pilus assembly PilX family protein n=1 Tax=Oleiagrimonas sp. C23AA TaxID=2719047 RepID=UPI0014202EAD|nr:PilX N-terminal domain-containing pilus assembly protein [Oleiagrimonas sp. C23AA]NII09163.1 hypothetical protein [Oleiagrimonas sp. C23AA]
MKRILSSPMNASIRASERGIALFVGLIFLVVLSLVAIIAMRGTLMEMNMVNNVASHERAFEVSETLRSVPVALFNENVFNRGWPADSDFNGSEPSSDFSFPVGSSMLAQAGGGLRKVGGAPVNLYEIVFQTGEDPYHPETWMKSAPDMTLSLCSSGDTSCSSGGSADIWIRPDGAVLAEGAGGAQSTGYRGGGVGAASSGGSMYFEILSVGHAGNGRAVTMAQYRQVIHN